MGDELAGDDAARPLDFFRLFTLGLNQVVGVGIFLLPARLAALMPGTAGPVCIVVTALALAPIALTYARLAHVCGVNGGAATYARLAFGPKVEALVLVISAGGMVLGVGAIASGISEVVLPGRPALARLLAGAIVVALGLVASRRVTVSARVWTVFTLAKMVPLGLLAAACVPALLAHAPAPAASAPLPSAPAAALLVVYAFQGFELVPVVSGRSRGWARSVPAAMLLALFVAALLYTVLQLGCVRLLGVSSATRAAPLVDLARVSSGPWLAVLLGTGALVSALGVAFGQLFVASELVERWTPRGRSFRVVVIVGLALAWVLLVHRSLGVILSLAGGLSLGLYILTALALIVLAGKRRQGLVPTDALVAVVALVVTALVVAGLLLARSDPSLARSGRLLRSTVPSCATSSLRS